MTETLCSTIESKNGIVNAYSWPTGMRNDEGEEYSVFFDPEVISQHDLYTFLYTVIVSEYENGPVGNTSNTPAIDTTFQPVSDTARVNEALDSANSKYPSVVLSVSTGHPATQIPPSEWISRIVNATPVEDVFAAARITEKYGFTLADCEFTTPELSVTATGPEITLRTYHSPIQPPTDTAQEDNDIIKIIVKIDDNDAIYSVVLEDITTRGRDQAGETWTYTNGIINKTEWFT